MTDRMGIEKYRISEQLFWECVSDINWSWLSLNLDKVNKDVFKYKLLKKHNIDTWLQVDKLQTKKYQALREFLKSYDPEHRAGLGDDGTWDLCSHMVGLGRDVYIDAFRNTEDLINRARRRDFKENFGYWIPKDEICTLPNSLDFIDKEN